MAVFDGRCIRIGSRGCSSSGGRPPEQGVGTRAARLVRRSLLLALGILVQASSVEATDPTEVIATWRGGEITRADYENWLGHVERFDRPEALEELVLTRALASSARKRGADREPVVAVRLEQARNALLTRALYRHVINAVVVEDEEIERVWRAHPEAFHKPRKLVLRNIFRPLSEDPDEADATRRRMAEIRQELLSGAPFEELALEESRSQSRFRGGRLGLVDPNELPGPVAGAVRDLTPGELSPIVEHAGGLSVFLCERIRKAKVPSREEALQKIRTNLTRERGRAAWSRMRRSLLEEAAPELSLSNETTVLRMEGSVMTAAQWRSLVQLRYPQVQASELPEERGLELLRDWALEVVCARRAVELGLDREPSVAAGLRWGPMQLLAREELDHRLGQEETDPDPSELERYFEEHRERLRHPPAYLVAAIHFGAEPDDPRDLIRRAREVSRLLQAGELEFSEAARRHSVHPSAEEGGRLGWMTLAQMIGWGPSVTKALRQMKPGDRTGVYRIESGLWIFELRDVREARPMDYSEAEARIRQALLQRSRQRREAEIRRNLLAELDFERHSDPPSRSP